MIPYSPGVVWTMIKIDGRNYQIVVVASASAINPNNDNVDVEVIFDSGKRYVATFFTLDNVQSLMNKYKVTQECKGGLYFWASDMVLVRKLSREVIHETVEDLILTGEIEGAFSGPFSD
jgi:hypothetical protein